MSKAKFRGKAAHPHLQRTCQKGYQAGEYASEFLIDKTDSASRCCVDAAVKQAVAEKWGNNPPNDLKLPVMDGDTEHPGDPNYRGCVFVRTHSKQKPKLVDRQKNDITGDREIPFGSICNVILTAKAYHVNESNGVTLYLQAVQFVKKGSWINTYDITDEFDFLDDEDDDEPNQAEDSQNGEYQDDEDLYDYYPDD